MYNTSTRCSKIVNNDRNNVIVANHLAAATSLTSFNGSKDRKKVRKIHRIEKHFHRNREHTSKSRNGTTTSAQEHPPPPPKKKDRKKKGQKKKGEKTTTTKTQRGAKEQKKKKNKNNCNNNKKNKNKKQDRQPSRCLRPVKAKS